jgi:alpha-tubulin suppressor-like RCC1 family protein
MRPGGAIDVTLTGTNLGGVIAVSLNGTALSGIVVLSASSIRVTVPESGVSTGPIRVTTSGGTSTNTILFVINAAPTAIDAGASHTCAVLADGTARCWGLNSSSQLGDGTTTQRTLPVTVLSASAAALTGISQIEAGANHSCLLRGTGETAAIRCVGSNANGQLGTAGTTSARFASTDATGGTGALTITAGSSFSMAIVPSASLSPTGAAACGLNTNGQLGIGSTTQQTSFTMLMLL